MSIAGLDIGSTGCKITVFSEDGNVLGSEYADYPVSRTAQAHELDAIAVKNAVMKIITAAAGRFRDIKGIGVTSFGESFVLTDANFLPLLPVILYTDPRGGKECLELTAMLGADNMAVTTGHMPHGMYSLPKLMWIKKNKPDIFAKAKYVFLIGDFIVNLLTGERAIDYSLASRSLAFDIRSCVFSSEILTAVGIDERMFSSPVPSGTSVGRVRAGIAAATGLSRDTRIIMAGHDQIACAVGAGAEAGCAVDGAGTVECVTPVFEEIPAGTEFQENHYNVVPYAEKGKYASYAFSYTGGALLKWCIDTVCKQEKSVAEKEGIDVHALLESGSAAPSGLLVLPHFAGAATPYMDTGAKGAIVGLSMATSAADVYRACMEGVAYEMRLNVEHMERCGIKINRMTATGGGARSAVWTQMKADILNVSVDTLATEEAGTVGAAMLTGVATGAFASLSHAKEAMVCKISSFAPDPAMHLRYGEVYERYKKLYAAVRPLVGGAI